MNMTPDIWIGLAVSILSLSFAVYMGIKNQSRQDSSDIVKKAVDMALVNEKLDNIDKNVTDIKRDMNNTKENVQQLTERVVAVEQSAKQAHHRLDSLEDVKGA